jgi:hypothetical protein
MVRVSTILTLSALLTLGSCASNSKMTEGNPKRAQSRNLVPHFMVVDSGIQKKEGRAPASVESFLAEEENNSENHSNKRLYFLTLYSQYESLKKLTGQQQVPNINVCPSFHGSLLSLRNEQAKTNSNQMMSYSYDTEKLKDQSYLALHPELLLPMTMDSATPRVIDLANTKGPAEVKALVDEAMKLHLAKTYSELSELCEFGESDNYYSYENLITHVQSRGQFGQAADNIKVLMRTTLFSNLMLINALESTVVKGRIPASNPNGKKEFSREIASRLGADWTHDYFQEVKRLRKNH